MAKKITAPHSYDPGKGRPQEYLAYLNAREMAYLRSINGNNMERGPRGLPSFPPKDAIGSSSNAPSKSPASSGVGRDSSRGIGQGAGGAAIGRGPSGGSPSGGGNLGGGGKGPGGPSGPNSSPSRAGGPSTGGGGKGPGGPSGPNSAPSGTRGVGGPSSPMGGQGPSFSNDTKARQEAQVRDAIKAVKNSPAFRNDASSGGIRTLSVGPMGTPVNVGPRVTPTQNRASVVGGWGVQAFNSAMPKAPTISSPMTVASGPRREGALYAQRSLYGANKQIYDRVPPGKQFGELGAGYDERIPAAPLGPREYSPYGMNIPDVVKIPTKGIAVSGGLGISALPSSGLPLSKTSFDGDEDYFNDFREGTSGIESLGDLYDANNTSIGVPGRETPKKDYVEGVDEPNNLPIGVNDVFGPFAPERRPTKPRDAEYGGFISPAAAATPDPEEKILEVENVPESAGMSFTPSLPTYNVEDSVPVKNREKYINAVTPSAAGNPFQKVSGVGDVYDPNAQFSEQTKIPSNIQGSYPGGVRSVNVGEPKDEGFSGIESSGEIVRDGEFSYPSNPDGTPMTAEDLDNLPPEVKSEYFNKVRVARQWDEPYPLTPEQKTKGYVAGAIGSLFNRGLIGAGLKVASVVPGEFGDAAEKLSNVRKTVNAYDRLDPLKKRQMRERDGKGSGFGGGSTSITSPGGGITDIGSGGKNEPPRIEQAEKEAAKPKPKPKEDGRRPAIYYKWDLGVDVPSPTDSDYTLYLKYLQEKAAAKAGMA